MKSREWAAKICDIPQYQEENDQLFNYIILTQKNNKYDICLDDPFEPNYKYKLNSNIRKFNLDFEILNSIYRWNQENYSIRIVSENALYDENIISIINEIAKFNFIDNIEINLDAETNFKLDNLSNKININMYSFNNVYIKDFPIYQIFNGNNIFDIKENIQNLYVLENQNTIITNYKNYELSLRNIVEWFWKNHNRIWTYDDFWMYSNIYRPLCFRYDGAIIPHHRMNTSICESGYLLEDGSIVSKNVEMFSSIFLANRNNSTNCHNCMLSKICGKICFGEQYEKTKDFFVTSPIDCQRQHFKATTLYKIYKELRLPNEIVLSYFLGTRGI